MRPDYFVPPPGHPLRPHVAAIFRLRAHGGYAREIVLPQTRFDLLFNLGDPMRAEAEVGTIDVLTQARVSGLRTAPLHVRPTGSVDCLGVSLRAESCAELLPMPADELTNASVDGDAVFRDAAALRERLGEAPDFEAQCAVVTRWLLARLRPDHRTDAVRWACRVLRREPDGAHAIAHVADTLAVSARHLRRLLAGRVGLGPSAYVRLGRFANALPLLHGLPSGRTLSDVAHAAGYFDQPHFCRDFRSFAGMTPQEYLRDRSPVPGVLFVD